MARTKKGEKAALGLTAEEKLSRALVPMEEQPYVIPENWVWTIVGTIASLFTGNSINEKTKSEKYSGNKKGLIYIATKDIDFEGTVNYETNVVIDDYDNFKIAPRNTALLCIEGGSAGRKVGFVNRDVCFVNKLCAFSTDIINPKYVYYYICSQTFVDQFNSKKHGLIGGVSVSELKTIAIPLPPLAEQTRIVSLIETLFSQLDEARAKAQAVVDGFEDRKAAILHRAFTGELTAKWREENGVGLDSWEEKALRNVLDVRDGTHDSPVFYKEGYPLVTSKNLKNGVITTTGIKYISEADYHRINERSKVDIGDVLFAMIGTIGNPVVIETEPNYAIKNVALFKNVGRINPYYLRYYLDSKEVIDKMTLESKGSTQRFVSLGYLRVFPVLTPSKEEQKEIVDVLDIVLAEEVQVKETAEQVISQIDVIKKSILARAFRGELGTNDPTDESAMELLKRVLE